MRRSDGLILVLLVTATALAADPDKLPVSPKAREALEKYDRAMRVVRDDFQRQSSKAGKQLVQELETAERLALKDRNLDEANRIHALAERAKAQAADTGGNVEGVLPGTKWDVPPFGIIEFGPNNSWNAGGARGAYEVVAPLRLAGTVTLRQQIAQWNVTFDSGMKHVLIVSNTGLVGAGKLVE
jgi:hypothetical protein